MSVVEMPQRSSQIDTNMKIKGISQIHNIRYEEGGMRFWKAFDIGKGKRELSKPLFGANYASESEQSGKRVSNTTMGWALKEHKSTRFSTAVKAYLNDKFLIGEETGNKASPTQVAREMHRERDDKGNRLFVGGDCLSSQQIAAYFSRLAATKKKHGSLNATASRRIFG